jgi:LysM domain
MVGYLYMIQDGDTLFDIAQRECGDGSLYPALAALNHIEDPNLIFAGANLIIDCEALQGWVPGSTPTMPGPNPDGTYG